MVVCEGPSEEVTLEQRCDPAHESVPATSRRVPGRRSGHHEGSEAGISEFLTQDKTLLRSIVCEVKGDGSQVLQHFGCGPLGSLLKPVVLFSDSCF